MTSSSLPASAIWHLKNRTTCSNLLRNRIKESKEYRVRTTRPLPDSGVRRFGLAMVEESWEQDEALQVLLARMLEDSLPAKRVRLRHTDKPYITNEIKSDWQEEEARV